MSDENKKVYGYVYYIRAYSTSENPTYDAGTIPAWYGGTKGTLLGMMALSHINQRRAPKEADAPGKRDSR